MKENSKQMLSGKAFEYALLVEFSEKLTRVTNVEVVNNSAFVTAKGCFESFKENERGRYLLSASFAVNFLMDIEPRLSHGINNNDVLQLEILSDSHGEKGDVRDVLAIRLLQKWEIGVSAKNNHHAVKHSRLSNSIDFGEKWIGINASKEYFEKIAPVFNNLAKIRENSNGTEYWSALGDYHETVYKPILEAFRDELLRLYAIDNKMVASKLVEYLVGNRDFYKVIKGKNYVEIHAYNLYGTLNHPFENILPKFQTPIIQLPTELNSIVFKEGTMTTLILTFNNNWVLSLRIHNASSKIEPSLKFDVALLDAPHSLFINKLSITHK